MLPRLCLALVFLPFFVLPSAAAGAAAGPEFLEQDQLSIPLERLTKGSWPIVVVNPGTVSLEAEVRIAGRIADALAFKSGNRVRLEPGGTATLTMIAGRRPHAGTGQLVLISTAGTDRLRVAVTPPPPFLQRYPWVTVTGGVLLLAAFVAVMVWRRSARPRKKVHDEARMKAKDAGSLSRVPAASKGFTHSDEPARVDTLRRSEYVRQLAELARHATPPMVIGVFGEWGTGKTSMLQQVRDWLQENAPECAHVWFNPWQHQYDENPILPLLHVIVEDLGLSRRDKVRRTLRTVSDVLGSLVLSASLKVDLSNVRKSVEDYDNEHFRLRSERTRLHEHMRDLIDEALAACGKQRLVVFVDDLDRCEPERIIVLLEALKLHFDRDNCVFVLGLAKGPLIEAVREKYRNPVGDYLDKIIQFPFEMPRLSEEDFARYLDGLLTDEIRPAGDMLRCGLRRNARAIKRFVNVLILQDRVAKERRLDPYDVSLLAAVLLLRDSAPDDYARLVADPALLRRVEFGPDDRPQRQDDATAGLSELTLNVVRELRRSPSGVPDDVLAYIDLVSKSPVPQPSDLTAEPSPPVSEFERQLELRTALEALATDLLARAGDEDDLLEPVLLVRGAERTGLASLDALLAERPAKVYVSGDFGSGKSVLAARLARRLAARRAPQVPVLLTCRALPAHLPQPQQWVTRALGAEYGLSATHAHAAVMRGALVLILDGIEELDSARRADFLEWARNTPCGVVLTGRDAELDGFETVRVLGVPPSEARRRLEGLLTTREADPDRLLGLTSELLSHPLLLGVLTADQRWIDDLPGDPADFLPWYVERGARAIAAADFDPHVAELGLRGIGRAATTASGHVVSGESTDVRTKLRDAGVYDVPAFLDAAVDAGLLCPAGDGIYHFVHPLIREHLAAVTPTTFMN